MSLTASFDDTTAKVTLAVTSAPAGATAVHLQRSVDQVTWTDVRGAQTVPLVSSAAMFLDYEHQPGQPNFYRALYGTVGPVAFVAAGTAGLGVNTSVTPGAPTGVQAGDLVLILASISNSGTGTVNTPAGWTNLLTSGNMAVLGRRWVSGDTMPTVTFTGGVSGVDTIAQAVALRNAQLATIASAAQLNTAQTSIPYPGLTVPANASCMVVAAFWQASFETSHSLATIDGFTTTNLGGTNGSGGGGPAHQLWAAITPTTPIVIPAGTATETGTTSSISRAALLAFGQASFVTADTATVTPAQTQVWLKNPLRPFLSRPVTVVDIADETRDSRSGVFNVIARTLPVAVTDLQSGRSTTLTLRTTNKTDADGLDDLIAVGEVLLVQPPAPGSPVPTMYAVPGGSTRQRVANTSAVRRFPLGLTEVATPDLTLAAVQSTWVTVTNTYATWSAEVAAKTDWTDVLQLVGTAADVITS